MFTYRRFVQFYETDAMGVVHHSNYIRFFEEARVALMRERGIVGSRFVVGGDLDLAVLETQCRHFKALTFNDEINVHTEVRAESAKIRFQYVIECSRYGGPVADGMSLHILVDKEMKARKPPVEFRAILEKEPWTETLRSNL